MEHAVTVDIIEAETEGKRREWGGEVEPRQHTAVGILHRGLRSALVSMANKQPPSGIKCKASDQKNQPGICSSVCAFCDRGQVRSARA